MAQDFERLNTFLSRSVEKQDIGEAGINREIMRIVLYKWAAELTNLGNPALLGNGRNPTFLVNDVLAAEYERAIKIVRDNVAPGTATPEETLFAFAELADLDDFRL